VEGETESIRVVRMRERIKRNILATLMFSQGVPMILGGDEMGRSQGGNNNAYCQDNETSWFDWEAQDGTLVAFTARLIDLRANHPVFRRRRWFQGRPLHGTDCKDLAWFRSDGTEMSDVDWDHGSSKSIGVFLNGEGNADGESYNRSWNCGVEGPTDDPAVLELRARQRRNFLATLLLSQGIPMILGGDEMGRTQGGNNNAYCQDNQTSWIDWEAQDGTLVAFTARLIYLRAHHPVFRRRRWFQGRPLRGTDRKDLAWFRTDGTEMSDEDWDHGSAKSIGVFLNGEAIATVDDRGEPIVDDSFLVVFNAHFEPIEFVLPPEWFGDRWVRVLDTYDSFTEGEQGKAGEPITVGSRSLVLLRRAG
ncbi:MAG: hypothetical protein M3203_03990, partial [Actinomycetota bacterium]|nr:hypothetical protein [Actinomycetota bacterium]